MMIHVVDAAGSEGRDPVDDIYKINAELEAYNPEIAKRPQVIAAITNPFAPSRSTTPRFGFNVVDAAGSEGRDQVDDIYKINAELEAYNPEIAKRPQVIAANKTDLIFNDGEAEDPVERLKKEFEPKGMKVFSISGATGAGIKELLYYVSEELSKVDDKPIVFEQEYFPDEELIYIDLPYTVEKEDDMYVVEGPKIEKMLGYTNLDSEKGFAFFQKFLKDTGILDELEAAGIQEGDTVKMYGLQFDYYK